MKKRIKIAVLSVLVLLLCCLNALPLQAASFSVSSNVKSVYVGDTFKVTITMTNMYAYFNASCSGPCSVVSGFPSDLDAMGETKSVTATYKATQEGTITIKVNGVGSDYDNPVDQNISKTLTIQAVKRNTSQGGGSGSSTTKPITDTRSKDNNLASLTIDQGVLTPSFKGDITEYSVNLEKDVSTLLVQASANDSKASVSGTGEIKLNAGDNLIKITCTAENGNPKVYTIKAYVDESPLVFLPYKNTSLGVVRNSLSAPNLDSFEEVVLNIEGNEVKGWHSPTRNITLLYLQDENAKGYYIYDENEGILTPYKQLAILGNTLGFVEISDDLKNKTGLKFQEVLVDDQTLSGWVFENEAFENYCLIYAMDDQGQFHFYQYESSQKTLQLYSDSAAITQQELEDMKKELDLRNTILYIVSGFCAGMLVLTIYAFAQASRYKKRILMKEKAESKSAKEDKYHNAD